MKPAERGPRDSRHGRGWLIPCLVLGLGFGGSLTAISLFSKPTHYGSTSLLLLGAVFASTGLAIASLVLRVREPFRSLVAIGAGGVLALHLRQQMLFPLSLPVLSSVVLVTAAAVWLGARATGTEARPPLRVPLLGAAAGICILVGGSFVSNEFRWHVLRHNPAIGTPLYYLAMPSVDGIAHDLFETRTPDEPQRPSEPAGTSGGVRDGAASGKDIVFVLVDTWRADSLSAYGSPVSRMPAMDELAAKSWIFTDVLANTSWTRPSVASMFTGLAPEEHGVHSRANGLDPELTTLAEVLESRGYETAAFVANWGQVRRDHGFGQGFDTFVELKSEKDYPRAGEAVALTLEFLEARFSEPDRAPLFLYLHLLDPHPPYLSGDVRSPSSRGEALDEYDHELRFVDRQLERLMAFLLSQAHPATILLTADHGEEFGEHGDGGHGHSLYPEVLHIPLVVFDGKGSGRLDSPLEGRDLFPLVASLAQPREVDIAAWSHEHARERRFSSVYLKQGFHWHVAFRRHVVLRASYTKEWAYVWSAFGETEELYDLTDDPDLLVNVASRHGEITAESTRAIDLRFPSFRPRVPARQSDEATRQLRALGYIESP